MFANEGTYTPLAQRAAAKVGIEAAVLLAIVGHESQFNPRACRAEPAIGDASRGLVQILERTARGLGFAGTAGPKTVAEAKAMPELFGLYFPQTNLDLGARLLAQLYKQYGEWPAAFSAYNGGHRPELGFGVRATKALRVVIARDQVSGAPIKWRDVKPGEFGNQPYVDDCLRLLTYFRAQLAAAAPELPPMPAIPDAPAMPGAPSAQPPYLSIALVLVLLLAMPSLLRMVERWHA